MRKYYLLLLFSVFINTQSLAQDDCTALIEENNYLKSALNLMNADLETMTSDDFKYKIIDANANIYEGTLEIKGIIENKGKWRTILSRTTYRNHTIVDPKGNLYHTNNLKFGKTKRLNRLQPDLPIQFLVHFKNIDEKFPIIKNLKLVFINENGREYEEINFKNIPVNWEQKTDDYDKE